MKEDHGEEEDQLCWYMVLGLSRISICRSAVAGDRRTFSFYRWDHMYSLRYALSAFVSVILAVKLAVFLKMSCI